MPYSWHTVYASTAADRPAGDDNRVTTHVSIAAVSLRFPFGVRPGSDPTL